MTEQTETPTKKAYRKWYDNNRDEFNARRRERYAKDKKYRDKAVKSTRRYRKSGSTVDGEAVQMYRELGGKRVKVFRISAVADQIGRSVQAIRQWESQGIIPLPSFDGGHRLYTSKQITLLKKIARLSDKYRYKRDVFYEKLAVLSQEVHDRWE